MIKHEFDEDEVQRYFSSSGDKEDNEIYEAWTVRELIGYTRDYIVYTHRKKLWYKIIEQTFAIIFLLITLSIIGGLLYFGPDYGIGGLIATVIGWALYNLVLGIEILINKYLKYLHKTKNNDR